MATRYTHFDGISSKVNGFAVGEKDSETSVISQAGAINAATTLSAGGVQVASVTGQLSNLGVALSLFTKSIAISADFDNTEQDSGWTIPVGAVIYDVILQVDTADASQTLDVGTDGTSNDPNGFLAAASVNATGLVKGTLLSSGQTKGALLFVDEDGAGTVVPEISVACGGDNVTYTGSDTTNTVRGSIHVIYAIVV